MLEDIEIAKKFRRQRRFVLCLLASMILINICVRYPLDHGVPYGSDTFFILGMGQTLNEDGRAVWILSPLSYFGLFPLSYPSGGIFLFAEFQALSSTTWSSTPWVIGAFFSVLMVLAGFMLLRVFGIRDGISAVLSGLMALSPFFVYTTYGQASTRGFMLTLFLLCLYLLFWQVGSFSKRLVLFATLTTCMFSLHRIGMLIAVFELFLAVFIGIAPKLTPRSARLRRAIQYALVSLGVIVVCSPFLPLFSDIRLAIPGAPNTFLIEWEFNRGFLFAGDSPLVLIGNLVSNYIGSTGLILLVAPFAIIAIRADTKVRFRRDVILILVLLIFTPYAWNVQYMQLVYMPFFFILAATAIQNGGKIMHLVRDLVPRLSRFLGSKRMRSLVSKSLVVFMIMCFAFSTFWFNQRANMKDVLTGEPNWPEDSTVNLGAYVRAFDGGEMGSFVSVSGHLERRVSYFSGWTCPIVDPAYLRAKGYLSASSDDFLFQPSEGLAQFGFVSLFQKFEENYQLDGSVPNWELYQLSMKDMYGFGRLYFLRSETAFAAPKVSTGGAHISLVIEMNIFGNSVPNLYTFEGTLQSRFLAELSQTAFVVYESDLYTSYLAAASV